MEEAERLCDRIVILDHGRVIADDTAQGLSKLVPARNLITVTLEDSADAVPADELRALPGVQRVETAQGVVEVAVTDLASTLPSVLQWFTDHGHSVPARRHRAGQPRNRLPDAHRACAARLTMRAFTALVTKDIRLYLSDRRAVLMSVLAPIAIASFFGFIFGETSSQHQASRVAVLLADEDRSAISTNLAVAPDGRLRARREGRRRSPRRATRSGAGRRRSRSASRPGSAARPRRRSSAGRTRRRPDIELLYDPSHATEASMVQGILAGHAMEAVSKEMFSGKTGRDAVDTSLARVRENRDIAPDQQRALTSLLEGVKGWNDVSQSSGGLPAAGQWTDDPVRGEEGGGHLGQRRALQRLRPLVCRHGRAVHPVHGDRDGRRPAAAAAGGAVEAAARRPAVPHGAARQPCRQHGRCCRSSSWPACSCSPGSCSASASRAASSDSSGWPSRSRCSPPPSACSSPASAGRRRAREGCRSSPPCCS